MGCVTDILQPLIPRLRGKKSQKRLQKIVGPRETEYLLLERFPWT